MSAGPAASSSESTGKITTIRRILSFPVAVSCLLSVLANLTVRERFDDPDMWWHLKLGEVTWTTHSIPSRDTFSYTTGHHAYVAHEWLSQLSIYAAYHLGGYSGLMVWLCCISSAVLIAGYALCALYSGNAKVAFLGAMTIWFFSTIGLSVRPQMIGYLLFLVELILLHLGRTRNPRWFWALPPLFALWINCHGSFLLGIAVASLLLFSSWFRFRSGSLVAPRWDRRAQRTLLQALLLSIPALFLNPIGIRLVLYPIQATLVPSIGVGAVSEWQPLQLDESRGLALLAMLACIGLLVIARRTELFWHEALWLAFAAWAAVSHRRLLFGFGIITAPILSRLMANFYDNYIAEQDRPMPNGILIAASAIVVVLAFPSRQNLNAQVAEVSPVAAVKYLQDHNIQGPMFNEWLYGGYLVWAAPQYPDFIDGRGDVFEWAGVLQEYGQWTLLQKDPNLLLNKYAVNFCLLNRDSAMANVLPLLRGWSQVYSDRNSVIFVRTGPTAAR